MMIGAWSSHLQDPEEKKLFENRLYGSKPILDRLINLIDDRLESIETIETNVEVYDTPSWSSKQAHYNGSKAALRALRKLIYLDQRSTNDLSTR